MSGSIAHMLNRTLEVWRPVAEPDGLGGRRTTHALRGTVPAKVDQPGTAERMLAQQGGSEHTHDVYMLPGSDVERGDQLRGSGETYRVVSTAGPSSPAYLKVQCVLIEPAPS